ncbi:MAG TPA: two-component regulator propeller domain-containing protein [Holophagaceae bacterium]|nr:two-component regulator propeller domain-containing protein [Holophagaceae bacterium]
MPAFPIVPWLPRWLRGATLAALGLLAAVPPLSAQEAAFRRFGLDDGLPQSQVTALMEDSHGFLWVGTNTNGLARLSAGAFTPFGIRQGVQARSISDLMEDRQGHVWAASFDTGLSEIAGTGVRNFGPDQALGSSQVYNLALDPAGRVLAGTRLGLYRQGAEGGFALVPLPDGWGGQPIFALEQEGRDHVWMASRGGRVARWDGQALEEHPLPAGTGPDDFITLKLDPAGTPYVLLRNRLLKLARGGWAPVPLEGVGPDPKLRTLTFSGGGLQISLGGDGLWLRDPDGRATLLRQQDGLPHESITAVLRDSRGILWIGSDGGGLQAQALPRLRSVTRGGAPGEGLGAIMGILELGPGDYLFAASTGIYRYLDGKGIVRHWSREDGMPSSECWAPLSDGHGGAWVGTDRGLVHWRPDGRLEKGPKQLDPAAVVALARVGDRLYAGTDRGLFELDAEGRYLSTWPAPKEQGLNQVFNLLPDRGELLVGLRLGIYAFKDGRWEKRYLNAPFATEGIQAMVRDPRGRLWVGTTSGLYTEDGAGWSSRGVREGLPDDNISFIQPLGGNRVAVGHGKGVSILAGDRTLGRLTHSQGLLSDETNHDGVLLDSRGRLWIGMIGGVDILEDAAAFTSPDLPPPVVTGLSWPGGAYLYPISVSLPPHPSSVSIDYGVAAPVLGDQPRLEALLEGVDAAWRPADGGALHYVHLAGGRYRFRLRVSADGIHWVEAGPLDLEIRLAWYERRWIQALFALAALLLAGGLVWWRVRRLARRARVLEGKVESRTAELARQNRALDQAHQQIKRDLEGRLRLMDMVTHDLRSPLTSLTLSVDRLREGPDDEAEREMLHGILHRETQRMEGMVRQLLDRSRAESLFQGAELQPCVPADLLQDITPVLRLKAQDKGLDLQIEAAPDTATAQVMADPGAMQQVLLNLFENALKFTPPGGRIGIRSTVERGPAVWRLEVWDTGRGLSPEETERILQPFVQAKAEDASRGWGLGLSICLSLLELQKGELRVRSEPGQGASFIITLPLIGA